MAGKKMTNPKTPNCIWGNGNACCRLWLLLNWVHKSAAEVYTCMSSFRSCTRVLNNLPLKNKWGMRGLFFYWNSFGIARICPEVRAHNFSKSTITDTFSHIDPLQYSLLHLLFLLVQWDYKWMNEWKSKFVNFFQEIEWKNVSKQGIQGHITPGRFEIKIVWTS